MNPTRTAVIAFTAFLLIVVLMIFGQHDQDPAFPLPPIGEELSHVANIHLERIEDPPNCLVDYSSVWISSRWQNRSFQPAVIEAENITTRPVVLIRQCLRRDRLITLPILYPDPFPLQGRYVISATNATSVELVDTLQRALDAKIVLTPTRTDAYALILTDPELLRVADDGADGSLRWRDDDGMGTSFSENMHAELLTSHLSVILDTPIFCRLPVDFLGPMEIKLPSDMSVYDTSQETRPAQPLNVDVINAELATYGLELIDVQIDAYELSAHPMDTDVTGRTFLIDLPAPLAEGERVRIDATFITRLSGEETDTSRSRAALPLMEHIRDCLSPGLFLSDSAPRVPGRYELLDPQDDRETNLELLAQLIGKSLAYDTQEIDGLRLVRIGEGHQLERAEVSGDASGTITSTIASDNFEVTFDFNECTMDDLAQWLAERTGCPVRDDTGLEDTYTFTFDRSIIEFRTAAPLTPTNGLWVNRDLAELGLMLLPARVEAQVVTFVDAEE